MKKIILLSLVFGLISSSAYATYYKTNTSNCSEAAMLAELDRATALHRAVITDVKCGYNLAKRPEKPRMAPKPFPKHKVAAKKFVPRDVHPVTPVIVQVPTVTVVTVTETESCTCCGC